MDCKPLSITVNVSSSSVRTLENAEDMNAVAGGKRSLEETTMSVSLTQAPAPAIVKDTPEEEEEENENDGEDSSLSDDDMYHSSSKKRKLSRTGSCASLAMAENHLKIRSLINAGDKWECDLERVHGLTYAQASLCISIAAEHFHSESFPPADGNLFLELAKEGWEHLKELDRLTKLYQECA
ncbi:hypothetical protein ACA910_000301 [Epithemia clementina (nom. ined.)]